MINAFDTTYTMLTANDDGKATAPRRLLVVHTFEGRDLDARAMARYQLSPAAGGSYHIVIDKDGETARENDDAFIPWSAGYTGNRIGYHFSLSGQAAFTRSTWLARPAQLEVLAEVLAAYSTAYGIPLIQRSTGQVRQGLWGVCGHNEISYAFGETDHTDPGKNFPYDVVISRAVEIVQGHNPTERTSMFGTDQVAALNDTKLAAQDNQIQLRGPKMRGWPQLGGRTLVDAVARIGEEMGIAGFKAPRK